MRRQTCIAGAGALAAGLLLTWAMWPSDGTKPQEAQAPASETPRDLIREVAPKAPRPAVAETVAETAGDAPSNAVERLPETPEGVPEDGYYTNKDGKVCLRRRDRSAYTNGVEQLLNMAIPSAPGAAVPPLPIISGDDAEELQRALKNKIVLSKDDDEATIERKMLITQGKLEMDEMRRESGMRVAEYVNALRDQNNDNAEFLAEARKIDQQIYEDAATTDEDYVKAREKINAQLRERGLPELEERE